MLVFPVFLSHEPLREDNYSDAGGTSPRSPSRAPSTAGLATGARRRPRVRDGAASGPAFDEVRVPVIVTTRENQNITGMAPINGANLPALPAEGNVRRHPRRPTVNIARAKPIERIR